MTYPKVETWCNTSDCKILSPSDDSDWYLEYRDGYLWVSGINRYWLIKNEYKKQENK
jgi:hypothetical protein